MGCGCASKSIFSGGKASRGRKQSNKRKGKKRRTKRRRGRKMKGGVSLLGDVQTGLMDVTNKLTGSIFVPPENNLQPASHNYGSGNSYLV